MVHFLDAQLKKQNASCMGFVVMPNHVHSLVRFGDSEHLSVFVGQWKRRSSMALKDLFRNDLVEFGKRIDLEKPIWQRRFYSFEIYSESKAIEKLQYMHNNPVKAGLVSAPEDWPHSSARYVFQGKSVGVPIDK